MDQLLAANELNLALVALTPALLITWFIVRWLYEKWLSVGLRKSRKKVLERRMRESIRTITLLVSGDFSSYLTEGLIVVEANVLAHDAHSVLENGNQLEWFMQDLEELEEWTDEHKKSKVLERMYRTFKVLKPE